MLYRPMNFSKSTLEPVHDFGFLGLIVIRVSVLALVNVTVEFSRSFLRVFHLSLSSTPDLLNRSITAPPSMALVVPSACHYCRRVSLAGMPSGA